MPCRDGRQKAQKGAKISRRGTATAVAEPGPHADDQGLVKIGLHFVAEGIVVAAGVTAALASLFAISNQVF